MISSDTWFNIVFFVLGVVVGGGFVVNNFQYVDAIHDVVKECESTQKQTCKYVITAVPEVAE